MPNEPSEGKPVPEWLRSAKAVSTEANKRAVAGWSGATGGAYPSQANSRPVTFSITGVGEGGGGGRDDAPPAPRYTLAKDEELDLLYKSIASCLDHLRNVKFGKATAEYFLLRQGYKLNVDIVMTRHATSETAAEKPSPQSASSPWYKQAWRWLLVGKRSS